MDLDGSIFWWLGGVLVLAALVISAVGIRGKDDWPPSNGVMWGVLAVLSVIVVGTGAFAVANASEEKEHREHELAEEEAEAQQAQEREGAGSAGASPEGQSPEEPTPTVGAEAPEGEGSGPEQSFDVTSPEDGSLVFDPDGIQAEAGTLTLAYTNPSPVTHNIYLEDENDDVLAESEDVVDGDETEISTQLAPGEYTYFCAIPGHREAGMEGVLTVE
jgi:plastocyanin